MRVADATREQLPALAALFEALSGLPSSFSRLEAAFDRMAANPDYHLLAAMDGEAVAGTLLGVVCLDCVGECRPFLVVENVIVAGPYRRRGVGRLLVEEVLRRGRERGCLYAMLVSGRDRPAARVFYAALGFDAAAGFKVRL